MITGRYGGSHSTLLDEEGEEEEQPHFGDNDEEEDLDNEAAENCNEEAETEGADKFYNWQWDDNTEADKASADNETNNAQNVDMSSDEIGRASCRERV